MQTIVDMLLGQFWKAEKDLLPRDLAHGVLTVPAIFFFYSFMGVVFLVVLNVLLAIIVHAFTEEKNIGGSQNQRCDDFVVVVQMHEV